MQNITEIKNLLAELAKMRRIAVIAYQKPDDSPVQTRHIEPYLFDVNDYNTSILAWQVVPETQDKFAWRTFRIDRITQIRSTNTGFTSRIPTGLAGGSIKYGQINDARINELYTKANCTQDINQGNEQCTSCGIAVANEDHICVLDNKIVCRECYDNTRPTCPYCGYILPQAPSRKCKCVKCANQISIKRTQTYFPSRFLTQQQLAEIKPYGSQATKTLRTIRDQLISNGQIPEVSHLITLANNEFSKKQPATYAQIKFAVHTQLPIEELNFHHIRKLLDNYQKLEALIENVWMKATSDDLYGGDLNSATQKLFINALYRDRAFYAMLTKYEDLESVCEVKPLHDYVMKFLMGTMRY